MPGFHTDESFARLRRMKIPEPDDAQWSWEQLTAGMDRLRQAIAETDAQGLPVGKLLAEGDRMVAAMDRLVEQRYPPGSPKYEEWWRVRQVKGEPPYVPARFGPRWSQ